MSSRFLSVISPSIFSSDKALSERNLKQPVKKVLNEESKSKPLSALDVSEVKKWLVSINYVKYTNYFTENNLSGAILSEVESVADLNGCGVSMPGPYARSFLKELSNAKLNGIPKASLC